MQQPSSFVFGRHLPIDLDKPAIIMSQSGESVTFGELEARSNQAAHLFRVLGLKPDDHIAILIENNCRFHEICWAAHRSGLHYTPISTHLTANEIDYIVKDCDAKLLVTTAHQLSRIEKNKLDQLTVEHRYAIGVTASGYSSWDDAIKGLPKTPIPNEILGCDMIYSSGTTGAPKGIKHTLPDQEFGKLEPMEEILIRGLGFTTDSTYLITNPLYHSLPKRHSMIVQSLGGTTVITGKFDEEQTLELIEKYQITDGFMVPTMFVRLLKLPAQVRQQYDLSSLRCLLHAAAPCPVSVKQAMIDWMGPIILELYGNTEECGLTNITSEEWLQHPGSIGRSRKGIIHILDDNDNELPVGETGTVWIEGCYDFSYHRAPEKTAESRNEKGWRTVGDLGYLDSEDYLYLTDRKNFTIISGGVNVYPMEVEEKLREHPIVDDAAVFGIPCEALGEQVKAVIQLSQHSQANQELADELIDFCKESLSSIKCPKSVSFESQLPYSSTGKLMKRQLRDKYSKHQEVEV